MSGVMPVVALGMDRTASPPCFTMTARLSLDPATLARWMGVIPSMSLRSSRALCWSSSSMMATLEFAAAVCSGDCPV